MTVRISARTAFEPDALVVCPSPTDLNTTEIPNPVIVVEVLLRRARLRKITGSSSTAIFRCRAWRITYSRRRPPRHDPPQGAHAGAIEETRVLREGKVILDPPGFEAQVVAFFATEYKRWRCARSDRHPPFGGLARLGRRKFLASPPIRMAAFPVKL